MAKGDVDTDSESNYLSNSRSELGSDTVDEPIHSRAGTDPVVRSSGIGPAGQEPDRTGPV